MKQSILFTKTARQTLKEEVSINAQLLIRAGFVNKLMTGVYTFLPLGLRVINKIEEIVRQEINGLGGQEIFMPSLQPKENWEITGRWQSMDDLYKLKDQSGREFALGPTHEEIVVPLLKHFINSYKDLPCYVYQFQNKFRMELRSKSGLLRGREFMMKDLYSFHLTEKDLDEFYEKAKLAYEKIFNRIGLGEKTYYTYASGGTFSKYSHEFQTEAESGEDTIFICKKCKQAINKEIIKEIKACPNCMNSELREAKAIEVGNIFKLQTKYSQPFDLSVLDEKGKKQTIAMGCYGIGLSRVMGAVVETSHDAKGIIWPEAIAPFKVHLVSLEKNKEAEKIYADLNKHGIETLLDDRAVSAGEKFNDADLIGLPNRLVISEKSLKAGGVEAKKRNSQKSEIINVKDLEKFLK